MQKHPNVLQYRASYCNEQSDFYSNCQNLSPESELNTIYRDDSVAEKCPLGGLYVLTQPNHDNEDERTVRSSNKCVENPNQESMIMECSDQSMLKLQFGKCTNMPSKFFLFLEFNIFKAYFNSIWNLNLQLSL